MKNPEVRTLIEHDLDIIRPEETVTSNQKIIMYIENEDGLERIIRGWNLIAHINNREIKQCIRCKNGKTGWAEFIDKDLNLQKEEGDVRVYLCVQFEKKNKPPKIDIVLSDMEIKN